MAKEIQRVDPFSCATISGLINGLLGLIVFSLMAIWTVFNTSGIEHSPPPLTYLIIMVSYPVLAFVLGGLVALIYNLCARWVGGIKIELNDDVDQP